MLWQWSNTAAPWRFLPEEEHREPQRARWGPRAFHRHSVRVLQMVPPEAVTRKLRYSVAAWDGQGPGPRGWEL